MEEQLVVGVRGFTPRKIVKIHLLKGAFSYILTVEFMHNDIRTIKDAPHCTPLAIDLLGSNQGSTNFNQYQMRGLVDYTLPV